MRNGDTGLFRHSLERWRRALVRFLPLAALLALALQAPCATASAQQNSSAKRLERLRSEISSLNQKIGREIARRHHLSAELGNSEKAIGSLQRKLAALEVRAKKLASRKKQLDHKTAASRHDAEAAQKELAAALRSAFILGREPRLKLALEGEDPAQTARILGYYGYYSRASSRRVGELAAEITRYQNLQTDLAATEKRIAQTRASRRQSLATLEKSHTRRKAVLAKLKHDIAGNRARIATLERDEKRLEKVVRSVDRDIAKAPSRSLENLDFARLRGELPWPVAGKIVNHFGSRRTDAGEMHWRAARIAAPAGTRVHAIARGRVAYAGWLPYYGLVLMVDHGQGYLTVYGHNEALYKQVGEKVEPGDVIATVGRSGGHAHPMLYFQIRHDKRALDPARWCRHGHPQPN